MTPIDIRAWIEVATILGRTGMAVGSLIRGWIGQAHPQVSAEDQDAAYAAIMSDDLVRAALAEAASRPPAA